MMIRRPSRHAWLATLVAMLPAAIAFASPPGPTARAEIAHLLDFLQGSGCDFYRNGSWYGAAEARSHLERKQQYLLDHDLVESAEQFIERAASKSSWSGEPYQVRCRPAAPVPSGDWLRAELARYRKAAAASAAARQAGEQH